jgi:hypothetical protein
MEEEKKINELLTSFYSGNTSPEEEQFLMTYFNSHEVSECNQNDSALMKILFDSERIPLPEGLAERLEHALDEHQGTKSPSRHAELVSASPVLYQGIAEQVRNDDSVKRIVFITPHNRKIYLSLASAAAVALLCIGLFFATGRQHKTDYITDTFTNPQEAAVAAEQALLFVASKLNKGLAPYEKFRENLNNTNKILNDNLTINL